MMEMGNDMADGPDVQMVTMTQTDFDAFKDREYRRGYADGMRYVLNDEQGDDPDDWCDCRKCSALRKYADEIEKGES